MERTIKPLTGHSGSDVFLMQRDGILFVRKIGNVLRNIEQYQKLSSYPIPKILKANDTVLDLEYIHGLDIATYLLTNSHRELVEFIINIIDRFNSIRILKDYSVEYDQLKIDVTLPFTKEDLISNLPKQLPQTLVHGDFTLENMIFNEERGFVLIDPLSTNFDSYLFDLAKLQQDTTSKWFLRDRTYILDIKLNQINNELKECYPEAFDPYLQVLMLSKVYNYTQPGSAEQTFILKAINKLWK